MVELRNCLITLLALIIATPLLGQYQFESKKAKKLYEQLEEDYANYDYDAVLEKEDQIQEYFFDKQDTLTALMYSFLGEAYYYGAGDLLTGLDFYEKEYDLRSKIQPGESFQDLAYNLGALYDEAGYYNKAEALYQAVVEQDAKEHGKKSEEFVSSVLALADHYSLTMEAEKGIDFLRKNDRGIERNTYEYAMTQKFFGDYYGVLGQMSKAERSYQKALEVLQESGYFPSLEYVFILNELANLYASQSRYPIALEIFETSLNTLDRLPGDNEDSKASINYNLAQVYYSLGNYDEAIELYTDILASDQEFYGEESL
jgi:tetratricopeptide (TPR) repeat protein